MRIRVLARHTSPGADAVRRQGEPVTFGVPLPVDETHSTDGWSLIDLAGVRHPVQTRVLERWPGGSIRWALVDAQVSTPEKADAELFVDTTPSAEALSSAGLVVSERTGGIIVDSHAARFTINVGGSAPFDDVVVDGSPAIDPRSSGLHVVDSDGSPCAVRITAVAVEESGPLRAVVKLTGEVRRDTSSILRVTVRVHFFAGLATTRLFVTLTNPKPATHPGGFWDLGDTNSALIKDVSLAFKTAGNGTSTLITASCERDAPWNPTSGSWELYQDSSGGENWRSTNHLNRNREIPVRFRGYRVRDSEHESTGLRSTPIASVAGGRSTLSMAVPQFWENFPKALRYQDGTLTVGLFPGQFSDAHEIQPGEQKTFECAVGFSRDTVTTAPLAWCRAPLVVCTDPASTIASGAVPFLEHFGDEHAAIVDTAVSGPARFELKREVIDQYGWRHFGEIYGDHEGVKHTGPTPLVSHYNNQYDPVAGFACQFLKTGDLRWWRMMTELAAHVIDIDVYHTTGDKAAYNHGTFWHTYHYGDADTATHRTYPKSAKGKIHGGGPSADHNYTTGLCLHYFLTGSEASRQTVIDSAQFVIDMDDGTKTIFGWLSRGDTGNAARSAHGYYGPGRGPANSLIALMDGHRLSGEARFLSKAERLIRRVIHPADDLAARRLDVPEQRWFYTMFLQSLGKYLNYKIERGELDAMYAYGRDSLLHYARWMHANEHPYFEKPEKLEFKTETWPAQDIRKSDVFYFAARHADGEEREPFLERARFFHTYSVSTLQEMPTRTVARPIVVLLTSGYMQSWFERQSLPWAPVPPVRQAYGTPEQFVPQRDIAKKRAMALIGAGVATLLAASIFLLL